MLWDTKGIRMCEWFWIRGDFLLSRLLTGRGLFSQGSLIGRIYLPSEPIRHELWVQGIDTDGCDIASRRTPPLPAPGQY